ncbi:MAG: acyltransferase [Actinomycetota bacterium]|nr:acyltransferase [Actinomycetota bacterium]
MAETRPRIEWMDLTKGSAILVVVGSHAVILMEPVTNGQAPQTAWSLIITVLEPMRMALFFMISGMLATAAISKPWSKVRRRTWGMTYLYVLWCSIFFAFVYIYAPLPILEELRWVARNLLVAGNGYWYLYALIVYFILARVTRRWPIWILLTVAVLLNLLKSPLLELNREYFNSLETGSMMVKILQNLLFFLIGLHFKELLTQITRFATWPRIAALSVIVTIAGVVRYRVSWFWEQSYLPASLLFIVLGVMLSSKLINFKGPRDFGSRIGTQTLPIFVLQFPFMLMLQQVFKNDNIPLFNSWVFALLFPIAFTAFVVLFALWLHRVTLNNRARYLFEIPDWVTREKGRENSSVNT